MAISATIRVSYNNESWKLFGALAVTAAELIRGKPHVLADYINWENTVGRCYCQQNWIGRP